MNGDALEKLKTEVKGMRADEWRGFLAAKVEDIKDEQTQFRAALSETNAALNALKLEVAKLPAHCVHEQDFIKMCNIKSEIDARLDNLEKEDAGRKAVKNLLLGAGGGVGILGGILAILKFIFAVRI